MADSLVVFNCEAWCGWFATDQEGIQGYILG